MRFREQFLNSIEEGGLIKHHAILVKSKVTAVTMKELYKHANFAKELVSVIVMIDLVRGYTVIQSMNKWARDCDLFSY